MTKRMLIDSTHAEETRVVVLDGNRLEDFDVETSTKRQLKGNIYLAKVVRVEPSLQAAFVEYGGNRHGFLAFSEIHPDYYQIPVADRQRLLEMQAEEARREEEEDDLELALTHAAEGHEEAAPRASRPAPAAEPQPAAEPAVDERSSGAASWASPATPRLTAAPQPAASAPLPDSIETDAAQDGAAPDSMPGSAESWASPAKPLLIAPMTRSAPPQHAVNGHAHAANGHAHAAETEADAEGEADEADGFDLNGEAIEILPPPETIGGHDSESGDDHRERRIPPRFLRNYKIQEVIRRRQIMLVQVVKEERGTKGAALTTYLSLAGRFGVLMPNSPRGGGISRKITSAADRRRLREVIEELDMPRGMGLIIRTAGANRPKPEIKRDCEYLLRLWDDIRDHTLRSVAPALIYEEASLIKRAIRDVYSRDIDEILVDGEDGWRAAHEFMRMLMPSHAKKVQLWRDGGQPLFARQQVEAQLDAMLMPIVQLRSGGYLVINQAEALVAIDVNSGRSTRERNIEETALRTNLEAADEVARQLRLRDLAGLIVIDFIDMESKRHNAMVERRLKEALKNDRARIQVGHISHFGLLEMSRQRLRPSLAETSFIACPHCGGTGHVRSTESSAIHVLRGIEDEGAKRRSAEIVVHVSTPVALYLLNHKRERLREIELRYTMRVIIAADDAQIAPQFRIEKVRIRSPEEIPPVITADRPIAVPSVAEEEESDEDVELPADEDEEAEDEAGDEAQAGDANADENDRRRKRRRRRRRGGKRDDLGGETDSDSDAAAEAGEPAVAAAMSSPVESEAVPGGVTAGASDAAQETMSEPATAAEDGQAGSSEAGSSEAAAGEAGSGETAPGEEDPRSRRRGRRGGRRRRREGEGELSPLAIPGADQPDLLPAYTGPTPADPFGQVYDIFDVIEQAEPQARRNTRRAPSAVDIVNSTPPEPLQSAEAGTTPAADATTANATDGGVGRQAAEPDSGSPAGSDEHEPARANDMAAVSTAADETAANEAHADETTGSIADIQAEIVNSAAPEPRSETVLDQPADAAAKEQAADAVSLAEVPTDQPGADAEAAHEPPQAVAPDAAELTAEAARPVPANDTVAAEPSETLAAEVVGAGKEDGEPAPAEPAIRPIMVGSEGESPAQKKRGWWRR